VPQLYVSGQTPGAILAADFRPRRHSRCRGRQRRFPNDDALSRPAEWIARSDAVSFRGASSLATGDFNSDGKSDLVIGGNGVSIWLGDGAGGFQSSYSNSAPADIRAIAAGDLRGNGKMDLIAVTAVGVFPATGKLWIFLGDGVGGATPLPAQDLDFAPNELWVGDLDGTEYETS